MKLLSIVLVSLMGIIGCGQAPNDIIEGPPMFTSVDPALQPYFNQFTALTGVPTTGITAGFTQLPNGIAGECVWGGVYNEVRINNIYTWSDPNMFQQLISHELGHCALFLYHINNCSDGTTAPDGTESSCNKGSSNPLSIMNWQMFNQTQADALPNEPIYYQYLKLNAPIP